MEETGEASETTDKSETVVGRRSEVAYDPSGPSGRAAVWTDGDGRSADDSYEPSVSGAQSDSRTDGERGDGASSDCVLSVTASRMSVETRSDWVTLLSDGVHSVVAPRLELEAMDGSLATMGGSSATMGGSSAMIDGSSAAMGGSSTAMGGSSAAMVDSSGTTEDSSEGSAESTGTGTGSGSENSISDGMFVMLCVSPRSLHLQFTVW
jgi:hypothetical protein